MLFFKHRGLGAGPAPMQIATAPVVGECTADGLAIWRGDHWERLAVGEACTTIGTNQPTVRTHDGGSGSSLVCTTRRGQVVPCPPTVPLTCGGPNQPPCAIVHPPMKMVQVGPFMVPYEAKSYQIHWSGLLPKDWIDFIATELAHDCSGCVTSSMRPTRGHSLGILTDFMGEALPQNINQDFVSGTNLGHNSKVPSLEQLVSGDVTNQNPICFVSMPDGSGDYGFYMWVGLRDETRPWDSTTNPTILTLVWRKIDRHWYEDAWNWIVHLIGKIIDFAGDLVCALVCTPGAVQGAMAAAKGNPAALAVEAGVISIGNCKCPVPKGAGMPLPPPTPWWQQWYVIVPVIAGLGLVLFSKPSKPKAATT